MIFTSGTYKIVFEMEHILWQGNPIFITKHRTSEYAIT